MPDLTSEPAIRLACFAGVLIVMAMFEIIAPRRDLVLSKAKRWFTNLTVVAVDTAVLWVLFPMLAIGIAELAAARGWGLLAWTDLPVWLEIVIAVILLDLAIYGQHVASHKVPILWRVHKVHHADRDIDVTTGLRFHPIEICLSMLYKFVVIIALGAPALGVFIFEVVLNGTAMFNHSNVKLPGALDRIVRAVLVTPDMHRVHHSIIRREHDTNYGFSLSIWDRLFRTYTDQPSLGHDGMTIGLAEYQTEKARPARLGAGAAVHEGARGDGADRGHRLKQTHDLTLRMAPLRSVVPAKAGSRNAQQTRHSRAFSGSPLSRG